MSDATVVVVPPSPVSPASPKSPTSAPSVPSPDDALVEVVHDDAMSLGYALSEINRLSEASTQHAFRLDALEGVQSAQLDAVTAVADEVADTQAAVAEIIDATVGEEPAPIEEIFEDEPDTPPGKSHWLRRSAKEWRAR